MGYSVPDKSFAGKTWHHPSIGSNRSQQSRLETGSACKETWTSEKIVWQTGNRRIGRTTKQVYSGIFAEEGVIGIRSNQKKGKSSPVMAEVAWNSCHVIRSLSHGSIWCSLAQGVLSQHQKLAVLAKGFTSIGSIKSTNWTGSDHSRLSRVLLRVW